jgi:glutaconate CoA-transferase subunit A
VVSTEEVIHAGVTIPAHLVAAVAAVPYGAHPSSCYPNYAYDREHLAEYVQAAQSGGDDLAKYLQQYVFDVDERGYRELIGQRRLDALAGYNVSTASWKEVFA